MVARLMPVGIDGLVVVGSVVLLQGGRLGWLGVGPGVGLSLFANVESGIRYGWLAAVWAGIPALSFFLATFILENWAKGDAKPANEPAVAPVTAQVEMTIQAPVVAPPGATDAAPETTVQTTPTAPRKTPRVRQSVAHTATWRSALSAC
jgi:hypothetical protein